MFRRIIIINNKIQEMNNKYKYNYALFGNGDKIIKIIKK